MLNQQEEKLYGECRTLTFEQQKAKVIELAYRQGCCMKETGHCPPVCPEIVSPIMREYAETPNAGKTLRKKKIKLISIVIVIGAVLLLFLLLQKSEFSLDDMQLSQDFQLILTCLIFSISGYQLPDFITALTSVIKTGEQEEAFSGFYLILFPCSLFFSFALAASLFQLI